MADGPGPAALWRADLDALQFDLGAWAGAGAQCLVHRLAFRALLPEPATPDACKAYFDGNREAFEAAARIKASVRSLSDGARFHLTSRDIARAIGLPRKAVD